MSTQPTSEQAAVLDVLHEVVERLAPIDRTPCSAGEREAADWLAARLRDIPGVRVSAEEEPSWGTFAPTATALGAVGLLGSLLALARRRSLGALLCALSIAGVVDEAQNGPRIVRRVLRRRKRTVNVIAAVGDEHAAGTLVVLAHHDAPQTGAIFDQTLQRRVHERAPRVIESTKTPLPQWWLGLAGPVAGVLAGISGRRGLARFAAGAGALATALVADVWRSPTVPGANDNLSGVAALVALAERLTAAPVAGMRVLLVSCGAEETLQDGIRAFMARHRGELDPERTWFVNLDTVGSPLLVQLEAEGPIWMEYYRGPWLRDLVHECAERRSIPIERGYRARASTDSVIPSRAGYAIATLVSITPWRAPANYHLLSDTPENLDYETVAGAVELVSEVAVALAQRAAGEDGGAGERSERLSAVPEGDTIHRAAARIGAALAGTVPEEISTPHPRHRLDRWPQRLAGRELTAVDAHGKHMLLHFDGGLAIHSHLRMTGAWTVVGAGERWHRSPRRAWLVLRGGGWEAVQFDGPVLELLTEQRARKQLSGLGQDVLGAEFDEHAFLVRLREGDPTRAVGDALLDQHVLAGIGNLWKSETCHACAVSPWRLLADLADEEALALAAFARGAMRDAVRAGVHARPSAVYRHAGRPCPRCGAEISQRGQGDDNRLTFWCAACQR